MSSSSDSDSSLAAAIRIEKEEVSLIQAHQNQYKKNLFFFMENQLKRKFKST